MAYIEFHVCCAVCGTGLCSTTYVSENTLEVEPCPHCLEKAKEENKKGE